MLKIAGIGMHGGMQFIVSHQADRLRARRWLCPWRRLCNCGIRRLTCSSDSIMHATAACGARPGQVVIASRSIVFNAVTALAY